MTVHICRDVLLGGNAGAMTSSYDSFWTTAVFLQAILLYSASSYGGNNTLKPPTYADLTIPYYSATQTGPNSWTYAQVSSSILTIKSGSCFLNLGPGKETHVRFSTDVLNLSAAAYPIGYPDISASFPVGSNVFTNRWIAIKDNDFPLVNSGIYDVTGFNFADNAVIINFRAASGSFPTASTSSLATASFWSPPPGSNNFSLAGTADPMWGAFNGATEIGHIHQYATSGSATFPRLVLDSPSPLGWQVRLSIEGPWQRQANEQNISTNDPAFSVIPGFGAVGGDFKPCTPRFGQTNVLHLHALQWLNTSSVYPDYLVMGSRPGLDRPNNIAQIHAGTPYFVRNRFYAWGDDQTGSACVYLRNQTNADTCFTVWGQPEDEPDPLPGDHAIHRLFAIGMTYYNSSYRDIGWHCGNYLRDGVGGVAFSLDRRRGPISCTFAPYVSIAYRDRLDYLTSGDNPPFLDTFGPNAFFSGSLEMMPVDIIAGTWQSLYYTSNVPYFWPLEPRRMGICPIARAGSFRGGSGSFQYQPTEDKTWFHLRNGVYLPWGGITPLP